VLSEHHILVVEADVDALLTKNFVSILVASLVNGKLRDLVISCLFNCIGELVRSLGL